MTSLVARIKHRADLVAIAMISAFGIGAFMLFGLTLFSPDRLEAAPIAATPEGDLTPTPTDKPDPWAAGFDPLRCDQNRQRELFILVVGADDSARLTREPGAETGDLTTIGLADSIRMVRVDFDTQQIAVLTIPRDTWARIVTTPAGEERIKAFFGEALDPETELPLEQTGTWGKINTALLVGAQETNDGVETLQNSLDATFGLNADRYVVVSMQVVVDAVDAVGGVEIDIPEEIGPFAEGPTVLDGRQALAYAKIRDDSDFYRTQRQNALMVALLDTYKQPRHYTQIPQMVDQTLSLTQTNLTREELFGLTCLALQLEQDDITTYALDTAHLQAARTTTGLEILLADPELVQAEIAAFMGEGQ